MKKIGMMTSVIGLLCCTLFVTSKIIKIMCLATTVIIIYLYLSSWSYRKYLKKFPGTVDSKIRNYDYMLLGTLGHPDSCGVCLNLCGVNRNFYTDWLLVERYYSFLKKEGEIIVKASGGRGYFNSKKINRFDIPALHEVTLWENGIDCRGKQYNSILVGNQILFLIYVVLSFIKGKNVPSMQNKEFQEMVFFCKERHISLKVIDCNENVLVKMN